VAAAVHGTLRPHYRPEDVHVGTLLGRLEALHSGITTLLDWRRARALGLGDRAGSITPGRRADLVLQRADDLTLFPANHPAGAIVAAGHPGLDGSSVPQPSGTRRV